MTMMPNTALEPEIAMLSGIFKQHPLELRFSHYNFIQTIPDGLRKFGCLKWFCQKINAFFQWKTLAATSAL
jgi:hypothetical protein